MFNPTFYEAASPSFMHRYLPTRDSQSALRCRCQSFLRQPQDPRFSCSVGMRSVVTWDERDAKQSARFHWEPHTTP